MNEQQNHKDIVSLRDYIEIRLTDMEKATNLAAENLKIRLESLNNWREQNRSERMEFITKENYENRHLLLENKIEGLQKFMYLLTGGLIIIEIFLRFIK